MLPEIHFEFVLAGNTVRRKKPDPEIYLLALEKTGLHAGSCVVIEDSANGVQAAKAAGMFVVATTNLYTEREDLDAADIIVTYFGGTGWRKGYIEEI